MDELSNDLSTAAGPQMQKGRGLSVEFYTTAVKDEAKSKEAGRDIYVDTDMISIRIPGEIDVRRRPVSDQDKRDYPALWAAHVSKTSQEAAEGFPLREWAGVTRSQAEELRFFGIRTVEHLANCPDSALQRVGPFLQLRQKARDWLEQAEKGAAQNKLRAENDELRARVETLERMVARQTQDIESARQNGGALPSGPNPEIAELKAQMAALLEAAKPKKRGRPPKAKVEA